MDDCRATVTVLDGELESYAPVLRGKPRILVGTKLDLEGARKKLRDLAAAYPDDKVLGVSSFSREGVEELARALLGLVGRAA
jgi:GTP-binding protein